MNLSTTPEATLHGRRICLVTSGHVASNPRLVKEADTLAESGALVIVISIQAVSRLKPHDRSLARRRQWDLHAVDVTRGRSALRYRWRTLAHKLARRVPRGTWNAAPSFAWTALTPWGWVLARAVQRIPADLYIAHNLAALPAAIHAARRYKAKVGFDAEDLHSEEFPDESAWEYDKALRRWLEDKYMPGCDYLTASAPQIANHYAERFRRPVTTILNVFPLRDRPAPVPRQPGPLRLYWFSQTVGPGRGLEAVLEIMGRMREPVVLHLQGTCAEEYRNSLLAIAKANGVSSDRLSFAPQVPPDDLPAVVARHDIGLSTEVPNSRNRVMCLCNKVFMYLLVGMPVALSRTDAQVELARELGESAIILDLASPASAAITLDGFASSLVRLERARQVAKRLADARFNWEHERTLWLSVVRRILLGPG